MNNGVTSRLQTARKRERVSAALAAVLLIAGFGIILALTQVFILAPADPSFIVYQPQEESETVIQRKADISSKSQPSSPTVSVIVSSEVSSEVNVDFEMSDAFFSTSDLLGGVGGDGLGDGLGGGGTGKMGTQNRLKSGFVGRFWDLKKTPGGADSKLKDSTGNKQVLSLESQFYNGGWNASVFSPYCEAKTKLYTSCFYMPNCLDNEATHAFDPQGKMGLKASRWVALYRAKVRAPKSGQFRFLGAGDSVLAVRFDGKNVLACGYHNLNNAEWNGFHILQHPECLENRTVIPYESCQFWNDQFGGFAAGEPFTVKEGQWYEMQVLVSEIGGGNFGFCLLIDDMSEEGKKANKKGEPLFQLFRTSFIEPTAKETYEGIRFKPGDDSEKVDPPYDPDSMIWEAKPLEIGSRGK